MIILLSILFNYFYFGRDFIHKYCIKIIPNLPSSLSNSPLFSSISSQIYDIFVFN